MTAEPTQSGHVFLQRRNGTRSAGRSPREPRREANQAPTTAAPTFETAHRRQASQVDASEVETDPTAGSGAI